MKEVQAVDKCGAVGLLESYPQFVRRHHDTYLAPKIV